VFIGPGTYGLPPILTAKPPAYTMVGKAYVGSFAEDLSMVCLKTVVCMLKENVFNNDANQ